MGDEKDKKKPAPQPAAAKDADEGKENVDLRDLDDAYQSVRDGQEVLFNNRIHGVQEVHEALKESDPPSVADQILQTLIIAGLGYASGGIATSLGARIVGAGASNALNTAVSTAIEDGLKDAATKVAQHLAQPNQNGSMSEYFGASKVGVEALRLAAYDEIRDQKKKASAGIQGRPENERASTLKAKVAEANATRKAIDGQLDAAKNTQFRATLSNWMTAMARSEMGERKEDGGTNLFGGSRGVGKMHPQDFYKKNGTNGVVYVNFGMTEGRPKIGGSKSWPSVKIAGVTQSAIDRMKGTALKDLQMPVIVSGTMYDGFLDSLDIAGGDNHVQFGRNEAGTTFDNSSGDGAAAMMKVTGKPDKASAAADILDNNILPTKLDHVLT